MVDESERQHGTKLATTYISQTFALHHHGAMAMLQAAVQKVEEIPPARAAAKAAIAAIKADIF